MAEQRINFKLPLRQGGSRITDIQYRIDNGDWVKTLQTHSPIVISGLEYGQTYEVELRAVNKTGASQPSNPVVITPTTVPDAPTIDSVEGGENNITINFTLPLNDGGSAITDIEYQIGGRKFKSSGSITSPLTVDNISGGDVPVRIRAVNENGVSDTSNQLVAGVLSPQVTISNITSTTSTLEVHYTTNDIDTINKLETSIDGGSTWSDATIENPSIIEVGVNNTVSVRLRVNEQYLSNTVTASTVSDGDSGGLEPLMDSDDWSYQGIVLTEAEFVGDEYRAIETKMVDNELMLLYRSKQTMADTARTASSVAFTTDLNNWSTPSSNPVLSGTMSWQGTDAQGRAWRTNGNALFKLNDTYYCYYIDRDGSYSGMRAFGVATSPDGVNWTQYDSPFFTVVEAKDIIPSEYFVDDPVRTRGRVYPSYATVYDNEVYLILNVLVEGAVIDGDAVYRRFLLKGTDPLDVDTFSFEHTPWVDGIGSIPENMYNINGSWFFVNNVNDRLEDNSVVRYIGIQKMSSLTEEFDPESSANGMLVNNTTSSSTDGRSLFLLNNKWHFLYSIGTGDIHLLSEK